VSARSSIWFGCVLRGDQEWIEIGADSNIQDGTILHVEHGGFPCVIGDRVTVGHRAVVHGSIVGDGALIGIGAMVLSRCLVGEGALVAAGAVVLEGTRLPPHTLWAGCPARQIRELTTEQRRRLETTYQHYVNNTMAHRAAETNTPTPVFLAGQHHTTE
jgi:carbonic anhydrase/acetyltransferase-like protein (isoleucine patch superfamily)